MQLWLNGEFLHADCASLSVADRGFLLGDGIFETVRVQQCVPALFDRHWARLQASATHYLLPLSFSRDAVLAVVRELCLRNDLQHSVVRITLSRGAAGRGLRFDAEQQGTLLITVAPLPQPSPAGISLMVAPEPRSTGGSEWAHKALHCTPNAAVMHKANLAGFDDALWLSAEGYVLETCIANIFLVQGHALYTPPANGSILPGVMREKVLEAARAHGFQVKEIKYAFANIEKIDEAFCTNAVRGIIPVGQIGAFLLPRTPGQVAQVLLSSLS